MKGQVLLPLVFAVASGFAQTPPDSFQVSDQLDVTHYPGPVIDITNKSSAPLCMNMYQYDQFDKFISCCATRIEPNTLYTITAKNQAKYGNRLVVPDPTSVRIKLIATPPIPGYNLCNPSTPKADQLISGLSASVNGAPLTTAKFDPCFWTTNGTCVNELDYNTRVCGFVQANGDGDGICKGAAFAGYSKPADTDQALWMFLFS